MKTIMLYTEPLIYEYVIKRNNQARVMRVLQTVRNEAIDACIEAIKDKIEKTNPSAIIWLAGLWQGIYEIEDMKKEINELGKR